MRCIDWNTQTADERLAVLARPQGRNDEALTGIVADIFQQIDQQGALALREIAVRLDGTPPRRLEITAEVVSAAKAALDQRDLYALAFARDNISAFHTALYPRDVCVDIMPGVRCTRVNKPIDCVGLYIPGGTAPLVSTLLMLALPARVAGVENIVAMTPPTRDGAAHPAMIVAAEMCGLDALYLIGGAQAIAAMTYGAAPVPRVFKIFGPGNAYVSAAKRYASGLPGGPAIDLPAGPSELLVIADKFADVDLVAADLLGQAEHDPTAQVLLITDAPDLAGSLEAVLGTQLRSLTRAGIARQSLTSGWIIMVRDLDQAVAVSNDYAPEHLALHIRDAKNYIGRIKNAGAVFVGGWAGETFGDYVCGPSHVLPTDGAARAWGGVSTDSFMRSMVVQEITEDGSNHLSEAAIRLANLEGLDAHAAAVIRRQEMMLEAGAEI